MPKIQKNIRSLLFKSHSIISGVRKDRYKFLSDREDMTGHVLVYKIEPKNRKFVREFNERGKIHNLVLKLQILKRK